VTMTWKEDAVSAGKRKGDVLPVMLRVAVAVTARSNVARRCNIVGVVYIGLIVLK